GLDSPTFPEGSESNLYREIRRLRQRRFRHARLRFLRHHRVEQRPVRLLAENPVALQNGLPEGRLRREELAAHRPPLRPHSRANKYEPRLAGGRRHAGYRGCPRLAVEIRIQQIREFAARTCRDSQTVIEMSASKRSAIVHVCERYSASCRSPGEVRHLAS